MNAPGHALPLPTRRATTRLGRALADAIEPGALVVLAGELGTGKTFLARAFLRGLGVPGRERVTSPTFALVHDYEGRLRVQHADLYRLGDASELGPLGLGAARARGDVLLVEWGAPYADELGGDALFVRLDVRAMAAGSIARTATLTPTGPASDRLARAVVATLSPVGPA
jgi:tRNA threonylcarbamoyl adenosine modification protein YjeE